MECAVALGSNSGDRRAHLEAAVEALRALDSALELSPVYETAPVDCPTGSGSFLNAVAIIQWLGTPEELLTALRRIESALGRPLERERNAPRTIDLDVLFAGETVSHDAALTLPHPRLHQRRFVLQPLADLRPDLLLPGFSQTVAALLAVVP